jgi:hypothetical protein
MVRGLQWLLGDTAESSSAPPPIAPLAAEAAVHVRELSTFTVDSILLAATGGRVSRQTAMRVPAFTRAYKLFTHTISCFPLREYVAGKGVEPRSFFDSPSSQMGYPSLMARTIGDLICDDAAYWLVRSVAWDGYPNRVDWLPSSLVVTPYVDAAGFPVGSIWYQGDEYSLSDRSTPRARVGTVIRFDGDGTGGWLTTGVSAVNLAASLLATVVNTAAVPAPSVILKNSGADLTPAQVDALLEAWETARQERTTAYLNATIEAESLAGYSPNDLQLTESRNAAATDVARNSNLDPVWVGAGVPGSSLTYANRVDLRKDLVDLALSAPMGLVTSRLSAADVTPHGHAAGFDTDAFLRANTKDLADIVTTLGPDIVPVDEARALLDFGGNTP